MLGVGTGLQSTKRRKLAFGDQRQEKAGSETAQGIGGEKTEEEI